MYADFRVLLASIPDDAAYYFKIADNVCAGKGFTFDGITQTNGFHPLWQYMLIAGRSIIAASPEETYRIYLVIQSIMLYIAGYLMYVTHTKCYSRNIAGCGLIVYATYIFLFANNLMETSLLVLILSVLYYSGYTYHFLSKSSMKGDIVHGLLLGMLVLTRLDMIFYLLSLFFYWSMYQGCLSVRDKVQKAGIITACVTLVLLPYLCMNYYYFNNAIPIHAALKSSFPVIGYHLRNMFLTNLPIAVFLISLSYVMLWSFRALKGIIVRANDHYTEVVLLISSVTIIQHGSFIILFMKWGVFYWHFIFYSFYFVIAICVLLAYIENKYTLPIILLIFVAHLFYKLYSCMDIKLNHSWAVASYDAALWVKTHTTANEILSMSDAGNFGYFSNRQVINLDGVVSNYQFQTILSEKRLRLFLSTKNVSYIAQHELWSNAHGNNHPDSLRKVYRGGNYIYFISYISHLYESVSDSIPLRKQDEVYRSSLYNDGKNQTMFIIWKIANTDKDKKIGEEYSPISLSLNRIYSNDLIVKK